MIETPNELTTGRTKEKAFAYACAIPKSSKSISTSSGVVEMGFNAVFFDLGDTLVKSANTKTWLPGAKALLASLKLKGTPLGIISNTAGLTPRQAILDILPIDFDLNTFDVTLILFSSEIGIEKPKRQIFEKAVTMANIPASQCLYCSESIVETLVAQHVGMRSVRVQTAPNNDLDALEQKLADFELII